jgi:hypothetical protein
MLKRLPKSNMSAWKQTMWPGELGGVPVIHADMLALHCAACYNAGTTAEENTFMANPEHLDTLRQGVDTWNAWRKKNLGARPDLSSAHLNEANLSEADLSYADLSYADLIHTDLSYADLIHTDLSGANLSGANLSHADLSGAHLITANLSGANFHTIHLNFTILAWVDLYAVEGLDTVLHEGPSSVDVKSVKLPEGKTRTLFLRGAGFSDAFIDYYPSLFTTAIQYASCFISYAHQDEALAKRLYSNLQDKGVRCWFAPHDMRIGDRIRARIDEAIHLHEKLLLLLSEHAIASAWVEDEVEAAMEKENQQHREVLFPVRLDDAVMHTSQAWAAKLRRTRHIGDFISWTDEAIYQQRFEELLSHLKVKTP